MKKSRAALLIHLLLIWALFADGIPEYIEKLRRFPETKNKEGILGLFNAGKDSIPFLINEIGRCDIVFNRLPNSMGSILTEDHLKICLGAYAAYVIEMILAIDQIDDKTFLLEKDLLFSISEQKHYLYWNGFVVNDEDKCVSRNAEEMKNVASFYLLWWEKNKDRSLDQLKKDWKDGVRPLSGTGYRWH